MPRIESRIDTGGEQYANRRAAMLGLIDELRALEARAAAASARAKPVFDKRGQLLPRARVARLLDPGAPWLELSTLAGFGLDGQEPQSSVPGGGVIVGIGFVAGVRCLINASDSGIDAGAIQHMGREKILRGQQIALENKLPYVQLIESAGANLLRYKVEGFIEGGRIFYNLARLSAQGIPVIAVVHGSSTAGGAYMPGLSDQVIMVRDRAKAFLAGPPLLKAATGEIATDEELGGAQMHTSVSGLGEHLAEDDADGLRIAREVVARLGWDVPAGTQAITLSENAPAPLYPPEELAGVVPLDFRQPLDMREVIAPITLIDMRRMS
ncbi:MAG: carboxyl transferase domain-containing protein, partial [Quisquiliibacterium sp.]